jgi:hypothetical protein
MTVAHRRHFVPRIRRTVLGAAAPGQRVGQKVQRPTASSRLFIFERPLMPL